MINRLIDILISTLQQYKKSRTPLRYGRSRTTQPTGAILYYSTEQYLDAHERQIAAVHFSSITHKATHMCNATGVLIKHTKKGRYNTRVNSYPEYILYTVIKDGSYDD